MRSFVDGSAMLRLMADDPAQQRARPVTRRFAQLIAALERIHAQYAVCGAIAMGAHGVRRFTEDIDVLVAADDLEPVVAALARSMREIAREPADGPPAHVRMRSRRARTSAGVDVDLLVPIDAAEEWALATAVRGRAFGRKFDVISAEALVILKLRAYLDDRESAGGMKHRVDASNLVASGQLDLSAVRRFARGTPRLAAELDRVLALPPPRGRRR